MNRYNWNYGRWDGDFRTELRSAPHIEFETVTDLLKKQREGKTLTLAERQRVSKYATEQRIKNLKKKKVK